MLSSTTQIQVFNVSYPDIETSVFLSCFHLIGASILAIFLSQRIRLEDFKSLHGLREISLARLYLVLSFFTSWIFLLVSGVLIAGVGLDMGAQWCDAGIVACITLYSFSKLFVYLFLGM
ncbi:hypothetical protein EW026_g1824 [Hermanssonia centrifuga]|uniref:Uncharacterized protein n=1 Tax=Hermanssonia centrifuga TaxID=98765 RepID=A0A4S4KRY6_9APHY|nr:hypothetical protein EW026_g1824 [Hermanssonia centrifuga]